MHQACVPSVVRPAGRVELPACPPGATALRGASSLQIVVAPVLLALFDNPRRPQAPDDLQVSAGGRRWAGRRAGQGLRVPRPARGHSIQRWALQLAAVCPAVWRGCSQLAPFPGALLCKYSHAWLPTSLCGAGVSGWPLLPGAAIVALPIARLRGSQPQFAHPALC